VAMLLAPPGSGKSRTPFSVAEELNIEYLQIKMTTSETICCGPSSEYLCVDGIIAKHVKELGASPEYYKSPFYPLFTAMLRLWISAAQAIRGKERKIVLLHLDEIQVYLDEYPPVKGETLKIRDFILGALSDIVNAYTVNKGEMSWLRVIFTGSNFFGMSYLPQCFLA